VDISRVRVQRQPGKQAAKNKLPAFKPGQIVQGRVNKILGKGYIQAHIHGRNLIASSEISVSIDEQLLFRVIKLKPKPHLQVMQSLDRSITSGSIFASDNKLLKTLLKYDLPITQEMIRMLQDNVGKNTIRKLINLIQENPVAWRRFLWNTSHQTADQLIQFGQWLDSGTKMLSGQFIRELAVQQLPEQILQLKSNLPAMMKAIGQFLRDSGGENLLGTNVLQQLEGHWMQWLSLRKASWNGGAWSGSYLPFLWEGEHGVLAFSHWKPRDNTEDVSPSRLSLISAFENGWVLQFLLEYREKDIAGAIDANENRLTLTVQELLSSFRQDLRKCGFSQIGVRVNTVRDLTVNYAQLLPAEHESLAYAG